LKMILRKIICFLLGNHIGNIEWGVENSKGRIVRMCNFCCPDFFKKKKTNEVLNQIDKIQENEYIFEDENEDEN